MYFLVVFEFRLNQKKGLTVLTLSDVFDISNWLASENKMSPDILRTQAQTMGPVTTH